MVLRETDRERGTRHRQRGLFDRIAERYDGCRQGYPDEIVELIVDTSGVKAGSAVLEVGCGTGQLTRSLSGRGFALTAIDIGASMVGLARRRVGGSVDFKVVGFEDFDAPHGSFDLIVAATAFHWVDPDVRFSKPVALLRPGGWLAVLSTREQYDDPFGTILLNMWVARSDDGGAWISETTPTLAEMISETGLFDAPRTVDHSRRLVLPVEVVVGVESTRATSLSWSADDQHAFATEMRQHLEDHTEVDGVQQTSLTMARVLPGRCSGS